MNSNMKAEINNENKAKFFAQYWGQDVLTVGNALCENLPENWIESSLNHTQYLQLKPLSEISDEDAVEVARICSSYFPINEDLQIEIFENIHGRKVVSWGDSYKDKFLIESAIEITKGTDFLRSRGYLVPWMGLSCKELIEAGWAKYKE